MKVIVFFDSSSFIRLTTYFWGLFYLFEFLITVLKEIKSIFLTLPFFSSPHYNHKIAQNKIIQCPTCTFIFNKHPKV